MQRGWCRVELLAKLSGSGLKRLYVAQTSSGEIVPATDDFFNKLDFRVFLGDFSCCYLKHEGSEKCDKESLVHTVLGLYFLILQQRDEPFEKAVLDRINRCKEEYFPRKFSFVRGDGQEEKRELFGPMIEMLEDQVENADMPRGLTGLRKGIASEPVHHWTMSGDAWRNLDKVQESNQVQESDKVQKSEEVEESCKECCAEPITQERHGRSHSRLSL
mmetsp:Transcript_109766/g.199868  ORF Transcript_109766/g.199868 Transcript_109766/m.199868 type:complete len:217 (+) Transcript_109766:1-651(+)